MNWFTPYREQPDTMPSAVIHSGLYAQCRWALPHRAPRSLEALKPFEEKHCSEKFHKLLMQMYFFLYFFNKESLYFYRLSQAAAGSIWSSTVFWLNRPYESEEFIGKLVCKRRSLLNGLLFSSSPNWWTIKRQIELSNCLSDYPRQKKTIGSFNENGSLLLSGSNSFLIMKLWY